MDQRIEDFMTDVSAQTNADETWFHSIKLFKEFGFLGAIHGASDVTVGLKTDNLRISGQFNGWRDAYFSEGDYEKDPLFTHTQELPKHFFTGAAFLSDYNYLSETEVTVVRRAEDFGLLSGLALTMPNADPSKQGGWNLISDMCRQDIEALAGASIDVLYLCAFLGHTQMETNAKAHSPQTLRLTPREQECYLWLSSGLRTEQIAHRLGIRPVTVDLHIRNARQRLGCATREQALAVALLNGLIDP